MEDYKVGDKVWFAEEKRPYTVRACDERFLICTKPYNFQPRTVEYTIVDLKEEIRGTDGYAIGGYDYYETEDCEAFLRELQEGARIEAQNEEVIKKGYGIIQDIGASHISHRNRIELKIIRHEHAKTTKKRKETL